MRALYGPNDGQRKLPQVLNSPEMEMVQGISPVNKTNFTQNYMKLSENTKFKKEIEQTETIQPDNPQHGGSRFTRRLKSTGKMIVGLQQRLDNQMGYVSQVGETHLKDNMYFKNGMYDNLDVVNFDQERFV